MDEPLSNLDAKLRALMRAEIKALQRRVAAWQPGDVVEVEGALQRRFWRTGSGTASVCEVNFRRGRKVPRAAGAAGERTA